MTIISGLSGPQIEALSMEIIESELGHHNFSPEQLAVVKRVIHATADFDFAKNLIFHPKAIHAGTAALKKGKAIVTDTTMAASGISKYLLTKTMNEIIAPISLDETRERKKEAGGTLAEAAMEIAVRYAPGIIVIGNAPTALLKVLELIEKGLLNPFLIIGVPVGFVNAAESKELLSKQDKIPYITCLGRKGGTPVAVAIINAIIRLMINEEN